MTYKEECHYVEFQDKSAKGWWYRLELLPAIDTATDDYYDGANNTFVPFSDNIITVGSVSELSSEFNDQPLGIATVPIMKLEFASDNMTADEFNTIVVNEGWDTEDEYDLHITNAWVLRTNYGIGAISASSGIYFMGIQRSNGGFTDDVDEQGKSKCSITIVNALSELARLTTMEKFAYFVFHYWVSAVPGYIRKQGVIYQQIFENRGNVVETFANNRGVFINTIGLNLFMLVHLQLVLARYYRIAGSTISRIGISHNHINFFEQDTSGTSGTYGSPVESIQLDSAYNNFEGNTAPFEQLLWLCCATLVDDAADITDYADLGHGLLVRSQSSGSYFEGETLADMLSNVTGGWGAHQMYIIRDNKMLLSAAEIMTDTHGASDYNDIFITLDGTNVGGITVAAGAEGGVMRSVTYNVDTAGSDDIGEFKYQIEGNLSEIDYSARCILHNLPRNRQYDQRWGRGWNPDMSTTEFTYEERIHMAWRQAGYDLRKLWYVANVPNFSSGLSDHALVLRTHAYCEFDDGTGMQSITPPTVVMDNNHWTGAFIEQQFKSGLPNTIAKYVGIVLSKRRRVLIECVVGMDVLGINHIGRGVYVTLSGKLSRFSYLHNVGQDWAFAKVMSVKCSIKDNKCTAKLLLLPTD